MVAVKRSGPDPSAPLHLVVGAEPPVLAQTLEAIRQAHGVEAGAGWEELHLDGSELEPDAVHGAVAGQSLFATRRLVLVRRAEALSSEAQEALMPFLDPVPRDRVLVLAARQLDKRTSFARLLKKAQQWELTPPTRARDLAQWVREQAESHGVHLSAPAVQTLVEGVGGEAALVPGELAKLAAYAPEGKAITPADVEALISTAWPGLPRYAVFDLLDAVSRGDAGTALERFRLLMRRGEAPLRILGMLARQWHLLVVVRGMQAERFAGAEKVAQTAGIQAFEARKLMQLATHWDEARLARAVELTTEADLDIKKGANAPTTMELLVLRLSRLSRGAEQGPASRAGA